MTCENREIPACPEQKMIITSQGKLSFREKGEGETIVFLHGILGSSRAWAFQFAALADNYHVVAWDAPGYLQSDLVEENIDAYVKSLDELIRACADQPIFLVGHSMGGSIASRYAALYPEKIKALILSCTHPGYASPPDAPISEKLANRLKELAEIGPEEYGKRRARDLLPFEDIPQSVLNYAAEIAASTRVDGLKCATRMLQFADNRPLLPKITAPTLILTGSEDRVVQPQLKEDLLRLVPWTQHIEMPGLGHAPYFQAPDYYNSLLTIFLSTH